LSLAKLLKMALIHACSPGLVDFPYLWLIVCVLRAVSLEREAILVLCCVDYISNFDHRKISRFKERLSRIWVISILFWRGRRLDRLIEAYNVILRFQEYRLAFISPNYSLRKSYTLRTECTLVLLAPMLRRFVYYDNTIEGEWQRLRGGIW